MEPHEIITTTLQEAWTQDRFPSPEEEATLVIDALYERRFEICRRIIPDAEMRRGGITRPVYMPTYYQPKEQRESDPSQQDGTPEDHEDEPGRPPADL